MPLHDETNTLHFEAIKFAYRQSRDGFVLSFVVHPNDMPQAVAAASIGTRYQVVMVEIGDDEKPVERPKPTPERTTKRAWRDI